MAPFLLCPYMRLIHAHIMLVNLHLYNVIQVSFRYHLWDSRRAIIPLYPVHFMGQSVLTKLGLLHILMDGHSAILSNEIKLERRRQAVEENILSEQVSWAFVSLLRLTSTQNLYYTHSVSKYQEESLFQRV